MFGTISFWIKRKKNTSGKEFRFLKGMLNHLEEKKDFCEKILSLPCLSKAKLRMLREKKDQEVPGTFKKSPGTFGLF